MVLPAGVHQCNFSQGNRAVRKTVTVGPDTAAALQRQLDAVKAKGALKPFFDFDHDDCRASGYPKRFFWQDKSPDGPPAGVYVEQESSASGQAAIQGKDYQAFSMVFHVDKAEPANVVCNPDADLNFGGLVNDPAFKEIAPLWAKRFRAGDGANNDSAASGADAATNTSQTNKGNTMETNTPAVAAKDAAQPQTTDALQAKETELAQLRSKLATAETAIAARRKKDAEDAVSAAVKRGAIPPQDEALKAKWQKLIEADPDNVVLLASQPDNPLLASGSVTRGATQQAMTDGHSLQAKEGPARIMQAYCALAAKNTGIRDTSIFGFRDKGQLAREMAVIYAKEVSDGLGGIRREFADMPLSAADFTDAAGNLGTLTGTLVAQRTLELFKMAFPAIRRVMTDFSDSPAMFKQTETTRIVVVPSVQSYSSTAGSDGRPGGWTTISNAKTTDVSITLDEHIGIPIAFDSNMLASTVRRLFDETAPAASYALAKYFVEKIYKLFTLANFSAYAVGSKTTTKVPVSYANFAVGLGDFARSTLTKIAAIFNPNEVPINDRIVLLNSPYFEQLACDPSLVTFFSGQQAPGIITENQLPRLAGFQPIEAPNLSAPAVTPNLVGMALHKAAVIAKTRLSNDYTQALPGSSYGSVTTITDPDIGISVVLVQYVNHTGGYAEWRIQVMLGAAVGDNRGGLCITSS